MALNQALLPEFDNEMANTRKTLERIPDSKWEFKPHPKSGSLGWLVNHIILFPGWLADTFKNDSFDFAPRRQTRRNAQLEEPQGGACHL